MISLKHCLIALLLLMVTTNQAIVYQHELTSFLTANADKVDFKKGVAKQIEKSNFYLELLDKKSKLNVTLQLPENIKNSDLVLEGTLQLQSTVKIPGQFHVKKEYFNSVSFKPIQGKPNGFQIEVSYNASQSSRTYEVEAISNNRINNKVVSVIATIRGSRSKLLYRIHARVPASSGDPDTLCDLLPRRLRRLCKPLAFVGPLVGPALICLENRSELRAQECMQAAIQTCGRGNVKSAWDVELPCTVVCNAQCAPPPISCPEGDQPCQAANGNWNCISEEFECCDNGGAANPKQGSIGFKCCAGGGPCRSDQQCCTTPNPYRYTCISTKNTCNVCERNGEYRVSPTGCPPDHTPYCDRNGYPRCRPRK